MIDERIDNRTGELIAADDAWERHKRIKGLRDRIESRFLELGSELYEFHQQEQWKDLDHSSFDVYIANSDLALKKMQVYRCINVFRRFTLELSVTSTILIPIGITRLDLIHPHATLQNLDEILAQAETLSISSLRKWIHETFAPAPVVTPEFPEGKYRCIVIDPPWPMKKIERTLYPDQGYHLDYPAMPLEKIAALPITDFAHEDGCHLYLWVTHKFLPAGLSMVEGWGFNYECLMTWVKPSGFTPYSWMYNTEHVIFARCGNLDLQQFGLKLAFDAPTSGHSVKPDIFYVRVLDASPGPRLEMYARRKRDGFLVWGAEIKIE